MKPSDFEKLTHTRLLEVLSYDVKNGEFTFRIKVGRKNIGDVAGWIDKKSGYRYIGIDQRDYLAHRLAWFYVKGTWPKDILDHEKGIERGDVLSNLRESSIAQNSRNTKGHTRRQSRFIGVYPTGRKSKPWTARLCINRKQINLGEFENEEEAYAARCLAEKKHHGVFAVGERGVRV